MPAGNPLTVTAEPLVAPLTVTASVTACPSCGTTTELLANVRAALPPPVLELELPQPASSVTAAAAQIPVALKVFDQLNMMVRRRLEHRSGCASMRNAFHQPRHVMAQYETKHEVAPTSARISFAGLGRRGHGVGGAPAIGTFGSRVRAFGARLHCGESE